MKTEHIEQPYLELKTDSHRTIEFIWSFIFEGYRIEFIDFIKEELTDKSEEEIERLMEVWWDGILIGDPEDRVEKNPISNKVEPEDVNHIKVVNKIIRKELSDTYYFEFPQWIFDASNGFDEGFNWKFSPKVKELDDVDKLIDKFYDNWVGTFIKTTDGEEHDV